MNILFEKKRVIEPNQRRSSIIKKTKEKKARQSSKIRCQTRTRVRKIGIQEVMVTMIQKLQSQLRVVSNELKECEIANNSLLFEIDKQKLRITTSEMNIGFLEDSKRKLIERLADKDEKKSCLEGIIQKLDHQIIKSKKVKEHLYRNIIELEEEISRLIKFVIDKEDELAQVHEKSGNQETELRHHQQQKERLQQQHDNSKKTHKLELTKVNKVLSRNT